MALDSLKKPIIKTIKDSIIYVEGKYPYGQGQMFRIGNRDQLGLVISADEQMARLLFDNSEYQPNIGEELTPVEDQQVWTYESYFGNIIDINGKIQNEDHVENLPAKKIKPYGPQRIFNQAKDIMQREPLNEALGTGLYVVDIFFPIGKGQRELIIGDRITGKTFLAMYPIVNLKDDPNMRFVFAMIGQKQSNIRSVYQTLKEQGAMDKTIIIDAPSNNSFQQYLAPYIAMSHAENLAKAGYDVLLILDDLTKHANIHRETALLIDKPVGREVFPGDMFYSHSSLLERAGKFKGIKGTITCLPIAETIGGDITNLISSNLISITDGQLITSASLYGKGTLPAININLSVSRIGSLVQYNILKQSSKEIQKVFNAYQNNLKFKEIKYNFSDGVVSAINRGEILLDSMIQRGFKPYSKIFILILSKLISWGVLDEVKDRQMVINYVKNILEINHTGKVVLEKLNRDEVLDDDLIKGFIQSAINDMYDYKELPYERFAIKVPFKKIEVEEIQKALGEKEISLEERYVEPTEEEKNIFSKTYETKKDGSYNSFEETTIMESSIEDSVDFSDLPTLDTTTYVETSEVETKAKKDLHPLSFESESPHAFGEMIDLEETRVITKNKDVDEMIDSDSDDNTYLTFSDGLANTISDTQVEIETTNEFDDYEDDEEDK